ncbi:MAG TPA: SDR family NAD(P)-dependent oxidoreductase [Nonomuraea sp.]|nr:SDR family NAD(P)-dependent oxidoreductase [Nonomuraea sp.]
MAAGVEAFGRIDVLVNNAGRGLLGAVEEASDAEVRAVYDVNVFGLLAVTRAVLSQLGIDVIIIEPGVFRTDFLDDSSLHTTEQVIEDYAETAGQTRAWRTSRPRRGQARTGQDRARPVARGRRGGGLRRRRLRRISCPAAVGCARRCYAPPPSCCRRAGCRRRRSTPSAPAPR